MIEFREVTTREELWAVCDLKVAPAQSSLVSLNMMTFAEAPFEPGALVRAMWRGKDPVGLLAMVNPSANPPDHDPELRQDAAYLWRLMVGEVFQGQGVGRLALQEAKRTAIAWGYGAMTLSVANRPDAAQPFYKRFGFELTGRQIWDDADEVEMICRFNG